MLRPNNNGHSAAFSGPDNQRLNRYFDTSVFSQPAPFTFGNTGRTLADVRGPGVHNLDFSAFKNFHIKERANLQFRAEAFNWTNTPKFNNPSSNIDNLLVNSDGSFRSGVFEVTGTNSYGRDVAERIIRLGLRLSF